MRLHLKIWETSAKEKNSALAQYLLFDSNGWTELLRDFGFNWEILLIWVQFPKATALPCVVGAKLVILSMRKDQDPLRINLGRIAELTNIVHTDMEFSHFGSKGPNEQWFQLSERTQVQHIIKIDITYSLEWITDG